MSVRKWGSENGSMKLMDGEELLLQGSGKKEGRGFEGGSERDVGAGNQVSSGGLPVRSKEWPGRSRPKTLSRKGRRVPGGVTPGPNYRRRNLTSLQESLETSTCLITHSLIPSPRPRALLEVGCSSVCAWQLPKIPILNSLRYLALCDNPMQRGLVCSPLSQITSSLGLTSIGTA